MTVAAYRAAQRRNAEQSRAKVLAFLAGLTAAEFASLAARVIDAHRAQAVAIADVALAEHLDALPLGVEVPSALDRIEAALSAILAETDAPDDRVGRLAFAEPLAAGRHGFALGLAGHGVPGWTREAEPGACALCESLTGSVLRADVMMIEPHPGCECVALPVGAP